MKRLRIVSAILVGDIAGFFGNEKHLNPRIMPFPEPERIGPSTCPKRDREEHLQGACAAHEFALNVEGGKSGIVWKKNLLSAGHNDAQAFEPNSAIGQVVV